MSLHRHWVPLLLYTVHPEVEVFAGGVYMLIQHKLFKYFHAIK